jgi:glycosyltransferase involved in cell wall biosynthesis
MKIVFVLPGIERTGGVKCTVDLANTLISRGHSVRLLHLKEKLRPVNVFRFFYTGLFYPHSFSWTKEYKGEIDSFSELKDCVFRPDEIIIAVGMWASAELVKLSAVPNVKFQYLHGATPWDMELMRRALSVPIPKIIVASYLKPIVESFGGVVLEVIGNGVDVARFYPSVEESQRDGIGFIYGSHEAKAPETSVEIAKRLQECGVGPIRIFGIERQPKQLNDCRYWRYPSVDLAREIYSRSIIWIVGSRSEGFSLPILEAMACGCVVISTDCGGPRDIIMNGENGFLVPVGDVDEIVNKVRLLLSNKQLRAKCLANSKETVKKFNWEVSATKIEQLINKLQVQ